MAGHDVHRDDMENDPTIAAFARDLQDAAAATPAPAVGASLAAVLDGRAPTAVYPEVVLPGRIRSPRRSLRLRWAVASAAFGIGVGSLGIAGALPGPVQRQVSRMAEVVGVDLPDGQPTTTTTVTPPPPVSVPASTSVPQRPTVVPVGEPPVAPPTTAGVRQPDGPGRSEDHRQDDQGEVRSGRGAEDDEPETTEPRHGDDDGPGSERTEDDDRDEDDKAAEDRDDEDDDRGDRRGEDEDDDEDREP